MEIKYYVMIFFMICSLVGSIIVIAQIPDTPMEYAREHDLTFNGTHYISNVENEGFIKICLKHPDFNTLSTSCKWIKIEK